MTVALADSLTANRYTYVNGDPINHVDPTGHVPCELYGEPGACGGFNRDPGSNSGNGVASDADSEAERRFIIAGLAFDLTHGLQATTPELQAERLAAQLRAANGYFKPTLAVGVFVNEQGQVVIGVASSQTRKSGDAYLPPAVRKLLRDQHPEVRLVGGRRPHAEQKLLDFELEGFTLRSVAATNRVCDKCAPELASRSVTTRTRLTPDARVRVPSGYEGSRSGVEVNGGRPAGRGQAFVESLNLFGLLVGMHNADQQGYSGLSSLAYLNCAWFGQCQYDPVA